MPKQIHTNNRTRLILYIMSALVLCRFSPGLWALDPLRTVDLHSRNVWTIEEGLPMNSVTCIAQTSDGYLWMGTETGLVRFDGLDFDTFNRENTPLLKNDLIMDLEADKNNGLWIATRGSGALYYQDGLFKAFTTAEGMLDNEVWRLLHVGDGTILFGTRNGLNRYNNGEMSAVPLPLEMKNKMIRALIEDRGGSIWVGTWGTGLALIRKRGERLEAEYKDLPVTNITTMLQDRAGRIWIGSSMGGLACINGDDIRSFTTAHGLSSNYVSCLMEDAVGNLWAGTYGKGVNLVTYKGADTVIKNYITPGHLSAGTILNLFEDTERNFWIGTEGGGLNCLRDAKVLTYTGSDPEVSDIITGVFQDSRGNILLSHNGGGLSRFSNGSLTAVPNAADLSACKIISMAEYPVNSGELWLGTVGSFILRLQPRNDAPHKGEPRSGRVTIVDRTQGLTDSSVRGLLTDDKGRLWAGCDNGDLLRWEQDRFQVKARLGYRINILFNDRNGHLWVATWGRGVCRLNDAGEVTWFHKDKGHDFDYVSSGYEDHEGVLWLSTYRNGLKCMQWDGTFQTISREQGLPDDILYAALEDRKHNLWVSSNRGIFRLSRGDLQDFRAGKIKTLQPWIFTREDGMKSIECNGANQSSGMIDRNGAVWFPTTRGVSVVDPRNLGINAKPPPVVIKWVKVEDTEQFHHFGDTARSPLQNGNLAVRFTGLSYVISKRIRFKYRLQPVDTDWVEAGHKRSAAYTGLGAGEYEFKVIAANSDGVWNNSGASFRFRLVPAFYQTLLFKVSLPLVLLLLFWLGFLGIKKYRALQKVKNKYKGSSLNQDEVETYIRKLEYFLEIEKIYKDSNLSLKILSGKLIISPRYLSQIINDHLHSNFYELINKYRIGEARILLKDATKKNISILEIGFDVGFSSKSAFNRAFKQFTQMTPTQFREKNKQNSPATT